MALPGDSGGEAQLARLVNCNLDCILLFRMYDILSATLLWGAILMPDSEENVRQAGCSS